MKCIAAFFRGRVAIRALTCIIFFAPAPLLADESNDLSKALEAVQKAINDDKSAALKDESIRKKLQELRKALNQNPQLPCDGGADPFGCELQRLGAQVDLVTALKMRASIGQLKDYRGLLERLAKKVTPKALAAAASLDSLQALKLEPITNDSEAVSDDDEKLFSSLKTATEQVLNVVDTRASSAKREAVAKKIKLEIALLQNKLDELVMPSCDDATDVVLCKLRKIEEQVTALPAPAARATNGQAATFISIVKNLQLKLRPKALVAAKTLESFESLRLAGLKDDPDSMSDDDEKLFIALQIATKEALKVVATDASRAKREDIATQIKAEIDLLQKTLGTVRKPPSLMIDCAAYGDLYLGMASCVSSLKGSGRAARGELRRVARSLAPGEYSRIVGFGRPRLDRVAATERFCDAKQALVARCAGNSDSCPPLPTSTGQSDAKSAAPTGSTPGQSDSKSFKINATSLCGYDLPVPASADYVGAFVAYRCEPEQARKYAILRTDSAPILCGKAP